LLCGGAKAPSGFNIKFIYRELHQEREPNSPYEKGLQRYDESFENKSVIAIWKDELWLNSKFKCQNSKLKIKIGFEG
jgi:hypothetical protein